MSLFWYPLFDKTIIESADASGTKVFQEVKHFKLFVSIFWCFISITEVTQFRLPTEQNLSTYGNKIFIWIGKTFKEK